MHRQAERRSSAFYQRGHRERLREQGLLKKELWVLPEYADDLAAIERQMRLSRGDAAFAGLDGGGTTMTATVARSATRATAAVGDLAAAHAAIGGVATMRSAAPSPSPSP